MSISVRKTKKGQRRFRVQIWAKGYRIPGATFTNREDAEKYERAKYSELDRAINGLETWKSITLDSLFQQWGEFYAIKNKAQSSYTKDIQMYRDYLQPLLGKLDLREIRPTFLDEVLDWLVKTSGLSNSSINKVLELLRSLLNFAVNRRHIPFSPMKSIKMLPIQEQSFDYWTTEEASKFLKYSNMKYDGNQRWVFVRYLLHLKTGIRSGESIALKFEDILFQQNLARISNTYCRIERVVKKTTKGKRSRFVPLDLDVLSEIKALPTTDRKGLIFKNEKGHSIDSDNFTKRNFNRDIKESGVRLIRFHDLRHTFASHFVMNGGSIHDLQMILGHSDIKMTMRYAHLAPEYIASKASIVRFDLS